MMKVVLGIETSCDETAAAVVREDGAILSNLVLSQIDTHQVFGGVVPEIAAREHVDHLNSIIDAALLDAGVTYNDFDAIAATSGPGLIGGVIVGMMAAKTIALTKNKPFIAINHLEGHALTPRLTDQINFPYLLLLISGGHTQILMCEDIGKYKTLGTTLDDAAGECFDKSAKLMGLPYPGGPHLEQLALQCKDHKKALKAFPLPRPMKGRDNCDFSFSGLKTAMRTYINAMPDGALDPSAMANLAYAFHVCVADIFEDRLKRALTVFKNTYAQERPTLVLSGGVSANQFLSQRMKEVFEPQNIALYAPPLSLCGDNAAMIAWAGMERLLNFKQSDSFEI